LIRLLVRLSNWSEKREENKNMNRETKRNKCNLAVITKENRVQILSQVKYSWEFTLTNNSIRLESEGLLGTIHNFRAPTRGISMGLLHKVFG
jgi:hypothetical protein